MKAYRIALTTYADTSGEGAKRYGGRWNLPGTPALYAGENIAVALVERLTIDPELFSSERHILYSIIEFDLPSEHIFTPTLEELPTGWNSLPATQASMHFGNKLLMEGRLGFAIPSIVDLTSLNLVINPQAELFSCLTIKSYSLNLDNRIIR
ncbi:RES family NAD+ phosphorylase [Mongoliitalea daihaiensis]|uniref:RES family NAD+ phosphorylase n=1 Tax=Mongoliitalea daihaiensis TaxID=2782006 RepID=UPI001F3EC331|nr:RES family NAD+ phosphorylase [Mongoliitalea daihaiensis]UJP65328.1 RES family NAD+ phosphorylase [Mongoliitalea daihaiensis]